MAMVEERLVKAYLTLGHYLRSEIDRLEDEYETLIVLLQSETGNKLIDLIKEQLKEKSLEIGVIKRIKGMIDAEQQLLLDLSNAEEKIKTKDDAASTPKI